MDKDSRYILAVHFSQNRGTSYAIRVMEKPLASADKPPQTIITDGLESYPDATRAVFPRSTKHQIPKGIREQLNNNIPERLQGAIKQRTRSQRGLQSIRTGQEP